MESLALEERWAALCIALKLSSEEAFELFEAFRFSSVRMGQLKATVNVNQHMSDFIAACQLEDCGVLRCHFHQSMLISCIAHGWKRFWTMAEQLQAVG